MTTTDQAEVRKIMEEILRAGGLPYSRIAVETEEGRLVLVILTDKPRLYTGQREAPLQALNTVIRQLASRRLGRKAEFYLDVNYTRRKRREALARKAVVIAERARAYESSIEMEPMTAFERFAVHQALSGRQQIETYSTGTGHSRRVVVKYIRPETVESPERP